MTTSVCHNFYLITILHISSVPYLSSQFVQVSAGIELIFLSVAAVFWVDNADVASCCYEITDFFRFLIFS